MNGRHVVVAAGSLFPLFPGGRGEGRERGAF